MTTHSRWPSRLWQPIFLVFALSVSASAAAAPDAVPLPENGATQWFVPAKPEAPLEIVTSGAAAHYFVKLVTAKGGKPVLSVFVRAGEKVDIKVPLGSYRIKYAAGNDWQGEKALFGEATQYFEAEKRFDFVRKGGKTRGFMVELIWKPEGNLSAKPIGKTDW